MSSFLRKGARLRPSRLTLATLAVLAALQSGAAWAVDPFVLKDIRVEGLQRTDPGTVFASLPFRIGDTYNDDLSRRRAQAVADVLRPVLAPAGITLAVEGRGEREPVAENGSAEGRQLNRRVSVGFTQEQGS